MILEGQKNDLISKELSSLLEIERKARQNNELELSLKTAKEIMEFLVNTGDSDLLVKTV